MSATTTTTATTRPAVPEDLHRRISAVAATAYYGKPGAVKRGRNPKWPHVPVLIHEGAHSFTSQIRGKAFASHAEAVAYAEQHVAAARRKLQRDLLKPNMRALREQYRLPRDLTPPPPVSDRLCGAERGRGGPRCNEPLGHVDPALPPEKREHVHRAEFHLVGIARWLESHPDHVPGPPEGIARDH